MLQRTSRRFAVPCLTKRCHLEAYGPARGTQKFFGSNVAVHDSSSTFDRETETCISKASSRMCRVAVGILVSTKPDLGILLFDIPIAWKKKLFSRNLWEHVLIACVPQLLRSHRLLISSHPCTRLHVFDWIRVPCAYLHANFYNIQKRGDMLYTILLLQLGPIL